MASRFMESAVTSFFLMEWLVRFKAGVSPGTCPAPDHGPALVSQSHHHLRHFHRPEATLVASKSSFEAEVWIPGVLTATWLQVLKVLKG